MNILSYGGGVNSTALAIILIQEDIPFIAMFVDTGAERPETIQFLPCIKNYLKLNNREFEIIKSRKYPEGIYTWMFDHKRIPMAINRGCTRMFKLETIKDYVLGRSNGEPVDMYIGIDAGESHRAYRPAFMPNCDNKYPLVKYGINREECKKIIKDAGLPIPNKSGCFICAFQRISEWRKLYINYPEYYEKAILLEENQMEGRTIIKEMTLRRLSERFKLENSQLELFRREEGMEELLEQNRCVYCMD